MPLVVGSQLGRYTIRSLLGAGGMGEVYLAYDLKLERLVALKVLPAEICKPQSLRRFNKEARAASSLSHPNVAHIYEIEEFAGVNFIALEYVAGKTLRTRLREGRMDFAEIVEIGLRVSSTLVAAHTAGIVHRDIKPENIMITPEGYIKVLDFGLAKIPELSTQNLSHENSTLSLALSEPGVMMGTVSYMSPEQVRGVDIDHRTDIWSLGVVLYEAISGRLPFTGATTSDVIAAILKQEPASLGEGADGMSAELFAVVHKALRKDRNERFAVVAELHQVFKSIKASLISQSSNERSLSLGSSPIDSVSKRSGAQYNSVALLGSLWTRYRKVFFALLLVIAAVSIITYINIAKRPQESIATPARPFKRLTFESGLQTGPTWSPDGRMIAYSSNASGNFEIWAQAVNGGDAIRLTNSPDHDWQPDWSPDGNTIVFRSERNGGGLFTVPAPFGGQVRKISSFGYNPLWSPDGSRILFFSFGNRLLERPRVYVVHLDGSAPIEILSSFRGIKRGALDWHPDGQRISFWGDDKNLWTVPLDGSTPVKSEIDDGVARKLREAALEVERFRWGRDRSSLYLEARSEGILGLWKVTLDPQSLKWIGGPERLTVGDGQDTEISLSRDGKKLAYTKKNQSTGIWSFPFNPISGEVRNVGRQVTPEGVDAWFPDLTVDGSGLIFSVSKQGMTNHELWQESLSDLKSRKLAEVEGALPFCPRWSPNSSLIAFSRISPIDSISAKKFGSIVLMNAVDGSERPLTLPPEAGQQPWRDYVYDWTHDGKSLLVSTDRVSPLRWLIAFFSVDDAPHAEKNMRILFKDPDADLWAPRLSPDGKWVCFLSQPENDAASSVLQVIPSSGGSPTKVTAENIWVDKPRWSPDGKSIFFVSNQNSYFLNVWGIRFDPVEGKAVGDPFQVTTIGSPAEMISDRLSYMEMTLNRKTLMLPITTVTGNIWVIENP